MVSQVIPCRSDLTRVTEVTKSSSLCRQHSYREVGILMLYLAVGVCVFSGFAYTAEYEEVTSPRAVLEVVGFILCVCFQDVGLDTIPACWWWGTVSMTTVGYGDVVPVTVAGKLAASGCILGGTLVVALPITIIFNKFSHFYRRQKALEASVRNNNRGKSGPCSEDGTAKDGEESEGDGQSLDDLDEEDVECEDEGGVINYSYVEHPSYTSILKRRDARQL